MARDLAEFFGPLNEEQVDALVEAMVLAADADGELSSDEEATVVHRLSALAVAKGAALRFTEAELTARIGFARTRIAAAGREPRIAAVKLQLGDVDALRGALALAVCVVASDGIVRTSEREVLDELATGLGLEADEAADLVIEFSARAP